MTLDRASYLAEAYTLGVEGAPPLVYSQLDLRDRPDHPDHRFALALQPGAVTAVVGDEDSGVGDLGRYALGLDFPRSGDVLVFGSSMRGLSYRQLLVLEQPFDGLTARAAHDLLNRVRYRKDNAPRTILITAQDLGTNVLSLVDRCIQCVDGLAVEGTR